MQGVFMKALNIVIAVPLEEELLTPLYFWGKRFDWSHVGVVSFVHIVKKNITPLEFGLIEIPDESTYQEMVPTLKTFLQDQARRIIPRHFQGEIAFYLDSDFSPEDGINEIIHKLKGDLLIVSTRGKHGLEGFFHNSFSEHMIKHAPCDVYVVRPHLKKSA
jgi:nucleotide-binding universal stress UspA family protein